MVEIILAHMNSPFFQLSCVQMLEELDARVSIQARPFQDKLHGIAGLTSQIAIEIELIRGRLELMQSGMQDRSAFTASVKEITVKLENDRSQLTNLAAEAEARLSDECRLVTAETSNARNQIRASSDIATSADRERRRLEQLIADARSLVKMANEAADQVTAIVDLINAVRRRAR